MSVFKDELARIDFLMKQEKRIMGKVKWQDEGRPRETCVFTAALAFTDQKLMSFDGQVTLKGRAATGGVKEHMMITMLMGDMPVDRLSYNPRGGHTNKSPSWSPAELHRKYLPPRTHRRYSWWDNRICPHDHQREMARAVEEKLMDTKDAIRYILGELSIIGELPPPPFQPSLGL